MEKTKIINFLATLDILLFLSLPVIAAWNLLATPFEIPASPLQEEQRSNMAKFKGYEDTLTPGVYEIAFEKYDDPEQNTETEALASAQITPAVQSVAYTLIDREETPTPTPEPTAVPTVLPTATPTPEALKPTQVAVDLSNSPQSLTPEQITFLGNCEAGMDPTKNTGNGYYGAFQFSYGTWQSMNTGYERADLAPLEVQIDAVQRLLQRSSIYTQFPACARKMQSLGMI